MLRSLILLLMIPSLWLGAACSDDDAPDTSGASSSSVHGSVAIDFAGAPEEKPNVTADFDVPSGSTAWEAIQEAVGESNLSFTDFGGSLGVFITGLYGVEAQGNGYWEFIVNGKSSDVGVGSYTVEDGDKLEFRYAP